MRPPRRLTVVLFLIIAAVAVYAVFRLLPFGTAILSDVHRRNARDLEIVASRLEGWSGAIDGVARTNFIRGRVTAIPAADRDRADGWQAWARLRHPDLREYRLTYATGAPSLCDTLRADTTRREGHLPFVSSYVPGMGSHLKVIGSFPLADLWRDDRRTAVPAGGAGFDAFVANIYGAVGAADTPAGLGADARVCYAAVIPLGGLLAPEGNDRAFANLMIAGPDGRILAQLGPETLPLSSISELRPSTDHDGAEIAAILKAANVEVSAEEVTAALDRPQVETSDVHKNLAPVEVDIGSATYIAYFRPFFPPAEGFPACTPARALPPEEAEDKPGATAAPTPPSVCYVVGLVPKTGMFGQLVNPPPGPIFALALALGGLLLLLPVLRLKLMGPADGMARPEVAALVLGIPGAASLAMLAVLVQSDLLAARAGAAAQAQEIATTAATQISAEVADRIAFARATAQDLARLNADDFGTRLRAYAANPALPAEQRPSAMVSRCIDSTRGNAAIPTDNGPIEPANPRPILCLGTAQCPGDAATGLARLELSGLVGADGRAIENLRPIACRGAAGGRTNLAGRDYFRRLLSGADSKADFGAGADRLVDAHVLAMQDGLPQMVISLPVAAPAWHGAVGSGARDVFAVGTGTIPSLIQPVLPPPFELMVVSTRDPRLPVLWHAIPGRAGAEMLGAMVDDPRALHALLWGASTTHRAQLERDAKAQPPVRHFRRFYSGGYREFVAIPVGRTDWTVLLSYPETAIDNAPIRTGWRTLITWACMSILFGGLWLLWVLNVGQHGREIPPPGSGILTRLRFTFALGRNGWPRLWPQQGHVAGYGYLITTFGLLATITLALVLLFAALGLGAIFVLLLALALRGTAGFLLTEVLGQPTATSGHLRPETQRRFFHLALALLLCVSVVPMLGMWLDARSLTIREAQAEVHRALAGVGGAIDRRATAIADLRWVLELRAPAKPAPPPGSFGYHWNPAAPLVTDARASGFAAEARRVLQGDAAYPLTRCASPASGRQPVLCGPARQGIAWNPPHLFNTGLSIENYVWILLLSLFAAALVIAAVRITLRSLCGFRVALEAVEYPRLFIGNLWGAQKPAGGGELQTLNHKSILVNAPWSLLAMIDHLQEKAGDPGRRVRTVDLAALPHDEEDAPPEPLEQSAPENVQRGDLILVVGLELVLEHPARRLAALCALERLSAQVERLFRNDPVAGPHLLFLTPVAPMDRILDAYEREGRNSTAASERENLRWARLFEDFATFQFRPIEVVDQSISLLHEDDLDIDQRAAIETVFREMRWLSPRIVNGCINDECDLPTAPGEESLLARGVVPLGATNDPGRSPWPAIYRQPVLDWAKSRRFPGPEAALAYLKGQFIEHYQRQWSSSTLGERMVLHHLAHGRFVNIPHTLAFGSLVRRGLVVLDPEPRLMNESFAMFVRQVEKLDAIREMRRILPDGAWLKTAKPLILGILLVVAALVALLAAGGQQIGSLVPVLFAGAPILAASLLRGLQKE